MTRLRPEGEKLEVWGSDDTPDGFAWQGTLHRVEAVCNRWRVRTRWWDPGQNIWREYLKVVTDAGLLCLLYRDLIGGGWFLARIYD